MTDESGRGASPERLAQGLSFRKGADDAYSIVLLTEDTLKVWLHEQVERNALLRGLEITPDLLAACWDEYKGGVNFRSGRKLLSN